ESVAELGKNYTALPSNQGFVPDSDGHLLLPQNLFLKYFAPDVDKKEAEIMAVVQGPFDSEVADLILDAAKAIAK
ncbi:hypothetical protein BGZ89_006983, partial [Linnemannia elongata]